MLASVPTINLKKLKTSSIVGTNDVSNRERGDQTICWKPRHSWFDNSKLGEGFLPRNLYSVASNPHQHNLSSISGNRNAAKHQMLCKSWKFPKK
jgi:hypothetical protein